jgi:hypothetical protein
MDLTVHSTVHVTQDVAAWHLQRMLPSFYLAVTRTSPNYFSPHLTQHHRPPESEENVGPGRAAGQEMSRQVSNA